MRKKKKLIQNETDFQEVFNLWMKGYFINSKIRDQWSNSVAFELKVNDNISFAFKKVEDHQIEALYNSAHSGMYYKIWDIRGRRNKQLMKKPFDCFFMQNTQAFIVVYFIGESKMYWIDINSFVALKNFNENIAKKKSVSISDFKKHCEYNFDLGVYV